MHASFPQNHPDFICFGETIFDADISFGNWHGHMLAYFEGYILVRDPESLDAASVR